MNRIAGLALIATMFASSPALAQIDTQAEHDAKIAAGRVVRNCVLKNAASLARKSKELPNDIATTAMVLCQDGFDAVQTASGGGDHFVTYLRERLRGEAVAVVVRQRSAH